MNRISFACPDCRTPLVELSSDSLRCPACDHKFNRQVGIWGFLLPERQMFFRQFIRQYETVRQAEGRGSTDPQYYRSLPFKDNSGKHKADWRIRSRSYQTLLSEVIHPLEQIFSNLVILDLGAGNCWLSNQLAQRGHSLAAIDLLTNPADGLGAWKFYASTFTPIQAEFQCLPLESGQADLVIYNASFHYSTSYEDTLAEGLRILKPSGRLVILDTPVYHAGESGVQMVKEREAEYLRKYGFPSNSIPSENYLTFQRIQELGHQSGLRWRNITPFYGIWWWLRPWMARLKGTREPARFIILEGDMERIDES